MSKKVLTFCISVTVFTWSLFLPEYSAEGTKDSSISTASEGSQVYLPFMSRELPGYYIAQDGLDSNPGTISKPWKTIAYAVSQIAAGDTLYIRGGTYQEHFWVRSSGTSENPITISSYEEEEVAIDGDNYSFPPHGSGTPLVGIVGDWVRILNLTVRYSGDSGIFVGGAHVMLDHINIHHNWGSGVIVSGDYDTAQNSRIWSNAMSNENGQSSHYGAGITARYSNYAVIQRNTVWENWGDGIVSSRADHTIIQDNISHDHYSGNVYITDSTNVLCQRNFVYTDPNSTVFKYGAHAGIMMGDEKYSPASENITIINNISVGNLGNFWWWRGVQGGGMKHVLIGNNTFINGIGDVGDGRGGVIISPGEHQDVRFENNLVQQDGALPVIATVSQTGITYAYNLWSKPPYSTASGPGDVIGDPKLAHTGGNIFAAAWYELSDGSPAINTAQPVSEVVVDYFGNSRDGRPDIGATEYVP